MKGKTGLTCTLALLMLSACLIQPLAADEAAPAVLPDGAAPETAAESLRLENSRFRLEVTAQGEHTGAFQVTRKSDGVVWYSNPPDRENNEEDKGSPRFDAYSQLLCRIYDAEQNAERNLNSYTGTDFGGNIRVKPIDGGVRLQYIFNAEKVAVPLDVCLEEDGVRIQVDTDEIVEQGSCTVLSVSPAPYFGCGAPGETGYLLVPDGSGALIRFDNGKTGAEKYEERVYGEDPAYTKEMQTSNKQPVLLPVFGASRPAGASFLGIIEEGAEEAYVTAMSSGMYNVYDAVFPRFQIRAKDKVVLGAGSQSAVSSYQYELERRLTAGCSVRYLLLEAGAGYADMALAYKAYLKENGMRCIQPQAVPPLFLDVYGGVKRPGSFLGIPMERFQTLTTVEQAERMVGELRQKGAADIRLTLRSADKALINGKMQVKPALYGDLGGREQVDSLKEKLNGYLYWEYDPLSVKRSGNGFSKWLDAAKRLSKDPVLRYRYKLSTYAVDEKRAPDYLASPQKLAALAGKYGTASEKAGLRTAAVSLGNTLYTDFNAGRFSARGRTRETVQEILDKSGDMVYTPNAYALLSAQALADVPTNSSRFDLEDAAVPFYQIVVSGTKEYAGGSISLDDDARGLFLKTLESGASLRFSLVYQNAREVRGTALDGLYGADYAAWKDEISAMQKELEAVYRQLGSREIIGHERLADARVTCTTFAGGKRLLVNHADAPADTDGGMLPGRSYRIV